MNKMDTDTAKKWFRENFWGGTPDVKIKDIWLVAIYGLALSAAIVILILVSLMISDTSPDNCVFPSGDPLSNSALAESLEAIDLSYEKANSFAMFKEGLKGTPLEKCFQECAFRTCYVPELESVGNCRVSCSSYGICINQCEVCDRKVATQEVATENMCITFEDCKHFGFK